MKYDYKGFIISTVKTMSGFRMNSWTATVIDPQDAEEGPEFTGSSENSVLSHAKNWISSYSVRRDPPTTIHRGSVAHFLMVLSSKLIQWDVRQMNSRFANPYALGHLLGALHKVEAHVQPIAHQIASGEVGAELGRAIASEFSPGFPPVKNVLKQLHTFVTSGKTPKLTGRDPAKRKRKPAIGLRNLGSPSVNERAFNAWKRKRPLGKFKQEFMRRGWDLAILNPKTGKPVYRWRS